MLSSGSRLRDLTEPPSRPGALFLGRLLVADGAGLFRPRIPEHLMAAFANILHSATDLQQRGGILRVARTHRFRADSLQSSRKGIKACAILLDQSGDLRRLQLNTRRLRPGSGRRLWPQRRLVLCS